MTARNRKEIWSVLKSIRDDCELLKIMRDSMLQEYWQSNADELSRANMQYKCERITDLVEGIEGLIEKTENLLL